MSSKSSQVASLYMLLVLLLSGCNQIGGGAERYRVLLFTKTAEYRYESIEAGISALKKLGKENGYCVDATENSEDFSMQNLKQYKLVIFLNTSGNVLNNTQQATFYENITGKRFDNPTVAPSVRSNLVTIFGRTAAYEGRPVYWDKLIKSEARLEANLKGLKV